jgi:DNA polymerase-1
MLAMIKCDRDPDLSQAKMLFQVHDEITFEIPKEIVDDCLQRIKYNMENPGVSLRVPLKAEPSVGNNWVEAH